MKLSTIIPWVGNKNVRYDYSRKVNRFPIHAVVSLVLENGAVILGTIKNMGTEGMFVLTNERPFGLDVGEEGDVGLASHDDGSDSEYRFPCRVVRLDLDGVALQLLEVAELAECIDSDGSRSD
ncbi:MAG: PilZ domain-containing protein [Magnetococcales bacterium]|nr:PilZ domain-containing protein [Magnetococcales bacterium]